MTSTVAVTFDATAAVGAVVDLVMETSPKNSDFPSEATCIIIGRRLTHAHHISDVTHNHKVQTGITSWSPVQLSWRATQPA